MSIKKLITKYALMTKFKNLETKAFKDHDIRQKQNEFLSLLTKPSNMINWIGICYPEPGRQDK